MIHLDEKNSKSLSFWPKSKGLFPLSISFSSPPFLPFPLLSLLPLPHFPLLFPFLLPPLPLFLHPLVPPSYSLFLLLLSLFSSSTLPPSPRKLIDTADRYSLESGDRKIEWMQQLLSYQEDNKQSTVYGVPPPSALWPVFRTDVLLPWCLPNP